MIIGVDAMGGDNAPEVVIEAAKIIKKENKGIDLIFVGDKNKLVGHLPESEIVHAPTVIEMDESPDDAFRKKKDSSIAIGTLLQKEGKIDAFVSAGHTGACVMFSFLWLERLQGVRRPALGAFFPTKHGASLVLDVGAGVMVKPQDLYQFGVMGAKCVEGLTGKQNPKVAILSVGEEAGKGSPLTKEASEIMQKSGLNFIGNIEGHQILDGLSDVVVCDGMVGNIMLKAVESVVSTIKTIIKDAINTSFSAKIGGAMLAGPLKKGFAAFNYEQYGGALLLGVKGVTIISHGRSNAEAIKNAVYTAADYVKSGVNKYIEKTLQEQLPTNGNLINTAA